jgi:hypothetical protein
VAISDTTAGATIYYTVDGTMPTTSSTLYAGPIPVAATTTIQAIAVASSFSSSAVASATYTIQPQTTGSVLFSDDFARTTGLGASWQIWYGSYSTDGANAVSGPAPIQGNWASVVPALGTNDYAVTATVSIPPRALYSGVVARGNPDSFTRDLYAAQISYTGAVNLYRRNAWSWTLLGSAAAGVVAGTQYTLQLAVTGTSPVHLEVSLNGTTVVALDDASASRITSGAPGIENYDAGVRYGRFEVSSPSGAVTPPPAAATPVFTPVAGTYPSAQSVTISDATAGATIYYTVDGTTPTTSSTLYTGPISVATTTTIQAMAVASGLSTSAVASATYTIQPQTMGSVLFSDDFARTTGLGSSWRIWYGSYSTDGSNAVSGPAPIQGNWASVVPSLRTNDYAVSATLAIPPRALYSGVVARGNPADFTSDLYAAQAAVDGSVNLYRRNAWSWTLLGSAAAGVVAGTPYTLQLAVTGTSPVHLEVSLGGTTVITVDDASGARILSGAPGIENYDAGVSYGRFQVLAR